MRQERGLPPGVATPDPAQQAFEAFLEADTPDALRRVLDRHPIFARPDFLAALEQFVAQQVPAPREAGLSATARPAPPAHRCQGQSLNTLPDATNQQPLSEHQGAKDVPHEPRYRRGDTIGGRYRVHQALAGGMGEVYLCLDTQETLPYALKTFQARYLTSPKAREVFRARGGHLGGP